ncbi:MAG: hypothetical protein AUH42_02390 [Gemmatimonadetes bacterium 13_1_40CM_70_11]|nr:MAG: hypothetical protein AUH42_02390 [Gemmatimonadetes bacterium 13_1_40CM_70_11]
MRPLAFAALLLATTASVTHAQNVRLSNDGVGSGYVSAYTLATGIPYSDQVLDECSIAFGRQNEPSVAVDPRDTRVLIGSSNDYCGVYAFSTPGSFVATGPIFLGYYRSEDGGRSFTSSLVPGYPSDASPFAALAHIRTADGGDPVIAWDAHGRVFMGSEASGDPAGTPKTFGDVWVARYDNPDGEFGNTLNDGKQYRGTEVVAKGSSAPNLLGKFHDKTAIEADRTGSVCDGNVYFAWARFSGAAGVVAIYFSRSTDHGATWSSPMKLTPSITNLQDPDIAVTGNGHVYVTFQQFATTNGTPNAIMYARSSDCGRTFEPVRMVTPIATYEAVDLADPQAVPMSPKALDDPKYEEQDRSFASLARDCGDFFDHCQSGYTFFRRFTTPRSTADQFDPNHEWIYITFDAIKAGTETPTGTSYGIVRPGDGGQTGVYFVRLDGATGAVTTPLLVDDERIGHQLFPDISADGGVLHLVWWDSRRDPTYSPGRPIGNDAAGQVGPALDAFAAKSTDAGMTWSRPVRLSQVTTNPNFEQFDNRSVPFAGDYLWITSRGDFAFAAWTDWRNTLAGPDPREAAADDNDGADVRQCRTFNPATSTWGTDQCPHDGGIDQNIYGNRAP